MEKPQKRNLPDLRFEFARIGHFLETAKTGVVRQDELKTAETALMRILGMIYGVDASMACFGNRPNWPPIG